MGGEVFAVSPETQDEADETKKSLSLQYQCLGDPKNDIAKVVNERGLAKVKIIPRKGFDHGIPQPGAATLSPTLLSIKFGFDFLHFSAILSFDLHYFCIFILSSAYLFTMQQYSLSQARRTYKRGETMRTETIRYSFLGQMIRNLLIFGVSQDSRWQKTYGISSTSTSHMAQCFHTLSTALRRTRRCLLRK